ncbi:MAG: OadG family protein [Anaerolineales bacterium]|jgi:Na+-transporting methylmalonyl-CoA/oxaloacetate decarboxylase gamma subunit|nr:OadG family protein [Anaerolineales bacterium]
MSANLSHALLITLIGMSLVFFALILLWGAMALLMRLMRGTSEPEPVCDDAQDECELRAKAAIAAVAVAMARDADTELHEFPLPQTAIVSAWQAVLRGNITRKRGNVR